MEKWQVIEKIEILKKLNEDPVERESVRRNRQHHIDMWEHILKLIEEEEKNEI